MKPEAGEDTANHAENMLRRNLSSEKTLSKAVASEELLAKIRYNTSHLTITQIRRGRHMLCFFRESSSMKENLSIVCFALHTQG